MLNKKENSDAPPSFYRDRAEFEREYFLHFLTKLRGNVRAVADHVGMERRVLYTKLSKLGLVRDKESGKWTDTRQ